MKLFIVTLNWLFESLHCSGLVQIHQHLKHNEKGTLVTI